ncbi:MAG: DUF3298 domain-containing protein [Bacteroidaceae bacterium]|nr:DUF3298 domain-containing protein [Bacteroidaceae bacterium]
MIKNILKLTIIAMALFGVMSCSVKNSVDLHFQYEDYTDTIFYKIDSTDSVSYTLNISIPIATTKNQDFNDSFNSIYTDYFDIPHSTKADSIIPEFVARQTKDYNSFIAETLEFLKEEEGSFGTSMFNHEYLLNSEISMEEDADIINLILDLYVYEGGAHGSSPISCYNISAHDGHLVDLEEIYSAGYETFVLPAIEKALVKEAGVSSYDQIHNAGYFSDVELYIPDNYIIRNDSIDFYYNEYDIAPYYMGTTKVTIPRYGIKP